MRDAHIITVYIDLYLRHEYCIFASSLGNTGHLPGSTAPASPRTFPKSHTNNLGFRVFEKKRNATISKSQHSLDKEHPNSRNFYVFESLKNAKVLFSAQIIILYNDLSQPSFL